METLPFIDLKKQQAVMRSDIDQAIKSVLDDGRYVLGPALAKFEDELAAYTNGGYALGVSSGTDALRIPLMAWGVGPGDAVFVPAFTYTATAEPILLCGASPVFVDVDPINFTIDLIDLKHKIEFTRAKGLLTPKVILTVDLFGLPVDYMGVSNLAKQENLHFLSDAAQAMGARYMRHQVGSLADVTATSFFPAKPLGCYGDGGAVFCKDAHMVEVMRSIRTHGQGAHKYDIVRVGLNARLDTLQAAILSVKLKHLRQEMLARQLLADRYTQMLGTLVTAPTIPASASSAWAQYTILIEAGRRRAFQEFLKFRGVPTMIYYPTPMHLQKPYAPFARGTGSFPVSERLCQEAVSLPMHPYMSSRDSRSIIRVCSEFFASCSV